MRVIRGSYRGVAEWRAQRRALEEARSGAASELRALEPAVVVSGPDEHAEGVGVLVEAVGPDAAVIYRRLIPPETARPEDAIEATIQEAWRRLVRQVGPPDLDGESVP